MQHPGINNAGLLPHLKLDLIQRHLGPMWQSPPFEEETEFCSSPDLQRYASDFWD